MANQTGVWGIEIGQSALKALRCHREGDEVVADAFDFIEYPKILSQPEADPEAMIREALEKFLSRNDVKGDRVAVSVPGQSGLAKFFKPPPVEAKKIADIVKYEARQQIPFDLNDVVWDYQMMPGSTIEEGYALETEIGLFAMKREQAYRQLAPFDDVGIRVDMIQLAPLAMYNMLAYDRMHERVQNEKYEASAPPSSSVLLSLGTDTTDLLVTNGFRIWQRSMPLGGNHFTRQLTKDLKLTFAKAEHLKRHAREAEDPKLIFQTMRPVFNDLVTEVQRSVGFYQSINKLAKIDELLISGNAVKLPGLAAYLGKNLGYDVHVLDHFDRLGGSEVTESPAFRDNIFSYGVCYGLCLQGLGLGSIRTSLVPQEILTERLVQAKKPWALAAVAALLVGLVGHYAFTEQSWAKVRPEPWAGATAAVDSAKTYSDQHKRTDDTLKAKQEYLTKVGEEVSGNVERRLLWLELLRTVNALLPREDYPGGIVPAHRDLPLNKRVDIHVKKLETQHFEDLSTWFDEARQRKYREELRNWSDLTGNPLPEGFDEDAGPEGAGWVIELDAYHFHNDERGREAANHVRRHLVTNFLHGTVDLPQGLNGEMERFTMQELGISYPLLLDTRRTQPERIPNPDYEPPAGGRAGAIGGGGLPGLGGPGQLGRSGPAGRQPPGRRGAAVAEDEDPPFLELEKFSFRFQFVWKPTTINERMEIRREAEEAAAEAEAQESEPDPEAVALLGN